MKGIELSQKFYDSFGKPMLYEQFGDLLPFLAVGLIGSGSECFGYDDDISQDHDFEPGFCIFLPSEDVVDRRAAFLLERAYAKLPKEFMGFKRSVLSPVGGNRHGVLRTDDFLAEKIGTFGTLLSDMQWLSVPEQSLAEVTNGVIFFDNRGDLTAARNALSYFPEDIRKKKLASHLLIMAQSGQYNYVRCLRHHEPAAAQLALYEFVNSALSVIFLLNKTYKPYYKWVFRAMRSLPYLSEQADMLEKLITTDNKEPLCEKKYNTVEKISSDIIEMLDKQELTKAICADLEKHAYSVNDGILNSEIRNLHILAAL